MANVNIQLVEGIPCAQEFQGLIRSQDVRQTEKDKVKVWACFRPGDVVKASVVRLLMFLLLARQSMISSIRFHWEMYDPTF